MDLIPLRFNFREIIGDWEQSHGTALASCLHVFSGLFSTGLIASSHAYDSLRFPWGSNPLTDPLLSSDRLRVINDGDECSRWEKTAAIADWAPAMEHLRVCHEGEEKDRNCGVCSNCLITALGFSASGKKFPAVLNVGSNTEAIKRLYTDPLNPMGVVRMEQMLAYAEQKGVRADWLAQFDACARLHKKRLNMGKPLGKLMLWKKKLWPEAYSGGAMTSPNA